MITHLDTMRIFHNEAVQDDEYMRNCYSDSDLSNNDGWLSLVSSAYFPFGKKLLEAIRGEINVQSIECHGNKAVIQAITKLNESEHFDELKSKFMEAAERSPMETKSKVSLMKKLIRKTFNARAKAATVAYRAKKTDRGAKGSSSQAFRQDLKGKTEKKTKEAVKRLLGQGGDAPNKKRRKKE